MRSISDILNIVILTNDNCLYGFQTWELVEPVTI